jgi:hypothetical protein
LIVQQRLARWLDRGASGSVMAPSSASPTIRAAPNAASSFARYGYAKSTHRYVYGVRLVLLADAEELRGGFRELEQDA